MKKVSEKTYWTVMERYGFKCQHPDCPVMGYVHFDPITGRRSVVGVEYSHIVFRSHSKALTDDPDNGIPLCPHHHRNGPESVHKSQKWREYYEQFLPDHLKNL